MIDESKVNRTHKHVVGYMSVDGKYKIGFNDYIYNDFRDGDELEKISRKLLKPEESARLGGWDGMSGMFIKDNIRVNTWWDWLLDYFWEIDTDDEAIQKKVYEWAAMVYDEYEKLKDIVEK